MTLSLAGSRRGFSFLLQGRSSRWSGPFCNRIWPRKPSPCSLQGTERTLPPLQHAHRTCNHSSNISNLEQTRRLWPLAQFILALITAVIQPLLPFLGLDLIDLQLQAKRLSSEAWTCSSPLRKPSNRPGPTTTLPKGCEPSHNT